MSKLSSRLLLICLAFSWSCLRHKNQNDYDHPRAGEKTQSAREPTRLGHESYHLFDPQQAKVAVSLTQLVAGDFKGKYTLPSFEMQFQGHDFVEIIRCQEGYRQDLEEQLQQAGETSVGRRKWVWLDSLGNSKVCKLASQRFENPKFQDLGAKKGAFFYVVNPCVSASLSTTGRQECSYQLALTNSLDYQTAPSDAFAAKAQELADAESAYDASMSHLLGLSRALGYERQACEFAVVHSLSKQQVEETGWDLLSAGIALGGGLAARALISKGVLTKIQSYVKKPQFNSLLSTLKSADTTKKSLYTAGIFAGAWAISTTIRKAKNENPGDANLPSCEQANALAEEILTLQKQQVLEQQMEKLISISKSLQEIDKTFQGYRLESFLLPN